VLPVLGVWGANAAGKSNILAAVRELLTHVERSYTDLKPAQEIPWSPFALRKERGSPPTQHDIDFESNGTRYHYDYRIRTRDDLRSLHESGRVRGVPVLGDLAEITKQFLKEVPDHGA
jgi:hypothetical protein